MSDWVTERLACPRDHAGLDVRGETLVCDQGHEYPFVDGIPVLVVDDELAPTQPGYWSRPEQIDAVRRSVPPPVEGDEVDPYVAELIIGTHGNLYRHLARGLAHGSFDVVFSYGVLQHFSKADVSLSAREIARVVAPDGYSWVQMPNAFGVRNLYQLARRRFREGNAFEVRYWTPEQLRQTFGQIGPTELTTDGFLTLNPQASDLDLLPVHLRTLVRGSELLRKASEKVPALTTVADSVNVRSVPRR